MTVNYEIISMVLSLMMFL